MDADSADKKSPERDENGRFKPGNCGSPGRPKGSRNRTTIALREAVLESLGIVGGIDYLAKLAAEQPELYVRLLTRLLPPEPASRDDGGVQLNNPRL